MPVKLSFYLSRYSGTDLMQFVPLHLAIQCYEIAVTMILTNAKCKFSPSVKAHILANYMDFKIHNNVALDFEVFMEYLKIRNDITNDNELKNIELFEHKWTMCYDHKMDCTLIDKYMTHYIENMNEWEKVMNVNRLRFKSEWLIQWTEKNKGKTMEECMMEFVDERYLKIQRLKCLLNNGQNIKQTNEYLNELKELIENVSPPKPIYCSNDIIDELENGIVFDF
eukprot:385027_1